MRIFLTGGTGFVGYNLFKKLLQKNHEITTTGYKNENNINNFLNIEFSYDLLKNHEILIHQAANNNTLDYNEENMLKSNLYDPINLFEKAYSYGCRKFIYASSTAVYGNSQTPYNEEKTTKNPLNIYAKSKLLFDEFAMEFSEKYSDVSIIGLRYCNIYGPNENHKKNRSSMILQMYKNIKNNKSPKLFKDGNQKRDWCYVKDVVEANLKAIEYNKSGIFNISNGKSISFNDLNKIINKLLNKNIPIEYIECNFSDKFQNNTECDISKAKKYLNWQPKYSIESGIKDYFDALESNSLG